ncbi:hypothetical protein AGMMS49944_03740 [Spirochaetia bacterium]|nr:hypothetical protein AGMMS49944_03740 [Spirochaetia bacterium]
MDLEIRVYNEKADEIFFKGIKNVKDIRHVLNSVRRGRNAVAKPYITTIHIMGDKNPFRIGREQDIVEWLTKRMKDRPEEKRSKIPIEKTTPIPQVVTFVDEPYEKLTDQECWDEFMRLLDLQESIEGGGKGFLLDSPRKDEVKKFMKVMDSSGIEHSCNKQPSFTNWFYKCKGRSFSIVEYRLGWMELRWG